MAHTRILTVNLPHLLHDMLSAIVAGHQGVEVVGKSDTCNVLTAVRAVGVNVIVIGTDEGRADAAFAALKMQLPTLRIVTIDREGRRATAHEPGAAPRDADEVSPEVLVEMLRGAAR